jgi:glycosyltransferase involved in cell wall biosynthesis
VAQIIDSLAGGGAAALLVTLAETLEDDDRLRVEVLELDDAPGGDVHRRRLADCGVAVASFPAPRLTTPARFRRLCRHLERQPFDLVHTHLTYANVLGLAAARVIGTPAISSLHNTRRTGYVWRRHAPEDWALNHLAARLIAVGPAVAEASRRLYRTPIEIVPNAIAASVAVPSGAVDVVRRELAPDPDAFVLLSVGRLAVAKGMEDLLQAFAEVHRRLPGARLLIAGEGPLRSKIEGLVRSLDLEGRVTLLGQRYDVPALLHLADVFVSASHWEGLPLAVLEALRAGRPVVASAAGDTVEVVTPDCGVLVPIGDPQALATSILELASDPARRETLGAAGRRRLEARFGAPAWKNRLVDLYRQVIAGAAEA